MSLSSALHTALTGMSAAETAVRAMAYNLANLRTPGFHSLNVEQATLPPSSADSTGQTDGGVQATVVEQGESTDLGQALIDVIGASTQFRGSAATFRLGGDLLDELTFLFSRR